MGGGGGAFTIDTARPYDETFRPDNKNYKWGTCGKAFTIDTARPYDETSRRAVVPGGKQPQNEFSLHQDTMTT